MVKRKMGGRVYMPERERGKRKAIRARDPENTNVAYRDSGNRIYDLE